METREYKNRDWLKNKYINEKFSQEEIGRQYNVSGRTINWWLKKFNISLRTTKEVVDLYYAHLNRPYKNKNWLIQKYLKEQLSIIKISKLCSASSFTIRKYLKIFKIDFRSAKEAILIHYKKRNVPYVDKKWLMQKYINEDLSTIKIGNSCNVNWSTVNNWIKKFNIIKNKDVPPYSDVIWLREKYEKEKLSTIKIAKLLNVSPEIIYKWIKKHDFKLRSRSEARKGIEPWNKGIKNCFSEETCRKHSEWMKKNMVGENHPNWQGGISFEPYTPKFNCAFKREIRKRDDYICQVCGKKENGKAHCIHHIDYNKKNSDPFGLITVCDLHNKKANFDRKKWQMFFEIYQEIRKI